MLGAFEILHQPGRLIDVSDHGAKGDGVSDDRPAIQSALNAAEGAGAAVFVPPGRFVLRGPLLLGDGATLYLSGTATIARAFGGGASVNATIRNKDQRRGNGNIAIVGGAIETIDGPFTGKHLGFQKVSGLRVMSLRFRGVLGDWNTQFDDCTDVVVADVEMESGTELYEDGLHFTGGAGIIVTGCRIVCGDDCISLTKETDTGEPITDVQVSNCELVSKRANAIRVLTGHGTTKPISNVTIANVRARAGAATSGGGISVEDRSGRALISGIVLNNVTLDCADNGGNGLVLDRVRAIRLVETEISRSNGRNIQINGCSDARLLRCRAKDPRGQNVQNLLVVQSERLSICECHFTGASQNGIQCGASGQPVSDITIVGCTIEGAAQDGLALVDATAVRVLANRCVGNRYGVHESGRSDRNVIAHNDLSGNRAGGVGAKVGLRTVLSDNVTQ